MMLWEYGVGTPNRWLPKELSVASWICIIHIQRKRRKDVERRISGSKFRDIKEKRTWGFGESFA